MAGSLGFVNASGVIPNYSDVVAVMRAMAPNATSLNSSGTTQTLSAQQILSGWFIHSGATAAVTVTTDTATNIINAMVNPYVGQTFLLFYANLNTTSGAVTVAAGTGVSTSGTLTIPIAGLRVFQGTVTNVSTPAVFLQSLFQIGSGVAA